MARILVVGNPQSPLVRARGLAAKEGGHEIFWFSPFAAQIVGVESYGLPKLVATVPVLRQVIEPVYFRQAVRAVRPDLVHVHYASKGLLALALARFHPLVVTAMGSDIAPQVGYRFPYAFFTRRLLESAECITVKSVHMTTMLSEIGDFSDKTELLTWGVDRQQYRPDRPTQALRERLSLAEETLVFLSPRATRPLYNKKIILEAFRLYRQCGGPDAVLLLPEFNPDPPYLRHLKQTVSSWGLEDQIRFLPPQDAEGMADLYALADVMLSVPSSDGFPQSIYEAWASGTLMLLGDLPQYRQELAGSQTAQLVKLGDPQVLADNLLWVAESPAVRNAARVHGPRLAFELADPQRETHKLLQIYDRLIGAR